MINVNKLQPPHLHTHTLTHHVHTAKTHSPPLASKLRWEVVGLPHCVFTLKKSKYDILQGLRWGKMAELSCSLPSFSGRCLVSRVWSPQKWQLHVNILNTFGGMSTSGISKGKTLNHAPSMHRGSLLLIRRCWSLAFFSSNCSLGIAEIP